MGAASLPAAIAVGLPEGAYSDARQGCRRGSQHYQVIGVKDPLGCAEDRSVADQPAHPEEQGLASLVDGQSAAQGQDGRQQAECDQGYKPAPLFRQLAAREEPQRPCVTGPEHAARAEPSKTSILSCAGAAEKAVEDASQEAQYASCGRLAASRLSSAAAGGAAWAAPSSATIAEDVPAVASRVVIAQSCPDCPRSSGSRGMTVEDRQSPLDLRSPRLLPRPRYR